MVHKRGPGNRGKRQTGTDRAAQSERAALGQYSRNYTSSASQHDSKAEPQVLKKEYASFASLPGEIRNMIYRLTLIADGPVNIRYTVKNEINTYHVSSRVDGAIESVIDGTGPGSTAVSGYQACTALHFFSVINRKIRKEARPFFFAHNKFKFLVNDRSGRLFTPTYGFLKDMMYLKACVSFLEHIGMEGRASLTSLKLDDACTAPQCDPTYHNGQAVADLFRLLHQCTNLISLDLTNILILAPPSIKRRLFSDGAFPAIYHIPGDALRVFANRFNALPRLKVLKIFYFLDYFDLKAIWHEPRVKAVATALAPALHAEVRLEEVWSDIFFV
ncbi:uncharacterized protein N0V89_007673 [Didymosphaeria variabile]|uniref:F-box domain-containing protein n=1 Tax=Didymosphaeria variabile TaxID=1932322 RepID=A0A9W8XLX8_9PLEO|nr:uncharacterized protein N0V89_007673 [Didymosphaeria variabile]KAJ4352325.1 hypothetical protein N0V89_007673 [Didymosphaeria variabile]